ncbi:MAG: hypothetical protein J6O56_04670 [Bacilli bacterium]|nr:hypothetical protein [Bacilli bacterium]
MKTIKNNSIHIQNDFEDVLVEDPGLINSYLDNPSDRYAVLFKMGMYAMKGYKIFDYILLNSSFSNAVEEFELDLYNNDVYRKYVDSVLSRDDEFLKAYMRVYLNTGDLDSAYESRKEVADIFINDTKYSPNYRLNGIMGLCEYKCDLNTIKYIKENVVNILNNIEELSLISEEQKQGIINNYLDSIDQYQRDCNLYYKY